MVHVSADLMVGQSSVLDTLTAKYVHLFPAIFFLFHLKERWGMDKCKLGVLSQERLKIELKLLLSANRKSCNAKIMVVQVRSRVRL